MKFVAPLYFSEKANLALLLASSFSVNWAAKLAKLL